MSDRRDGARHVAFHCGAGAGIGLGHLARCSVVSERLRDAGIRTSIAVPLLPAPASHLLERFDGISEHLDGSGPRPDVVVLDGVPADLAIGGPVRRAVIDDGPPRFVDALLVVNPNLTATPGGYATPPGGEVLAGARFAIVEPRVVAARDTAPPVPDRARRVVVTCGGSDPAGMTERYVTAARSADPDLEIRVIVGPLNPRSGGITHIADAAGATVVTGVRSVADEAASADIALTTLGTTAAEVACLGVPNLAVAISPGQVPFLDQYAAAGLIVAAGRHDEIDDAALRRAIGALAADAPRRRSLRAAGLTAVDGRGADRTAGAIARLAAGATSAPSTGSGGSLDGPRSAGAEGLI